MFQRRGFEGTKYRPGGRCNWTQRWSALLPIERAKSDNDDDDEDDDYMNIMQ